MYEARTTPTYILEKFKCRSLEHIAWNLHKPLLPGTQLQVSKTVKMGFSVLTWVSDHSVHLVLAPWKQINQLLPSEIIYVCLYTYDI